MTNKAENRGQGRPDHRRAHGLRPVQLWVLDTRDVSFVEKYGRQCRLANTTATVDPAMKEWDAWIDAEHRDIESDLNQAEQRQ